MPTIRTHLWYDREAREAAEFYVSVFGNGSKVNHSATLHGTPSGSVDMVSFDLLGRPFEAISAGPLFRFNPSITLRVACASPEQVDRLWASLSPGGSALMELGSYPFSPRFGWLADRYGLSWQLGCLGEVTGLPRIAPLFMFVGGNWGRAEEAMSFWTAACQGGEVHEVLRYGPDEGPDRQGTVKTALFSLFGQEFAVMDSAYPHAFSFSEAVSLLVECDSQSELDTYWEALSADPQGGQCGWTTDRFGVSWQIVPRALYGMLRDDDSEKVARVTRAFLGMKKFDLEALERAYQGVVTPASAD